VLLLLRRQPLLMLPVLLLSRFDTPLFYSEAQLQELSGTTLAAATAARKRALLRHWQQLRPAVEQMLQQVRALQHSMWCFLDLAAMLCTLLAGVGGSPALFFRVSACM
jgi:hypothetical protein